MVLAHPSTLSGTASENSSFSSDPTSLGDRSETASTSRDSPACSEDKSFLPAPPSFTTDHAASDHSADQQSPPPKASAVQASSDANGGPGRAPVMQWHRYGAAVSHVQALKDLQEFNQKHPMPPPATNFPVWVGPPSPTAPAALLMGSTPPLRPSLPPARLPIPLPAFYFAPLPSLAAPLLPQEPWRLSQSQ
eukprot:GGOE01022720.1.p2 GENE.GGOE01022720.1~~GGOE01022720.1.p2  ORF type:complete len:192 (+),score=20.99 GGOE01022720.1:148-723(+)